MMLAGAIDTLDIATYSVLIGIVLSVATWLIKYLFTNPLRAPLTNEAVALLTEQRHFNEVLAAENRSLRQRLADCEQQAMMGAR